jgi:hypothetical protein
VGGLSEYFDHPRGQVNYLTHISRRHEAVFVEVPKAGCTVVKRVMQHSERGGEPYEAPRSVHDRATSPLGAPVRDRFDVDEVFGCDSPYFRFAFVRNPFTRALSCYLEKIAGEQWLRDMRLPVLGFDPHEDVSFVQFLTRVAEQAPADMDIHWAPQSLLLGLGRVEYAFLGRFESFQRDLRCVIEHLGMEVPDHMVSSVTTHTTNARDKIAEHYDDTAVSLVRTIYRDDFARLGYGREPVLPG